MLIAPFPKNEGNLLGISGIAGIINNGDQSTFAITNPEATAWNIGSETVGADFPLENLSATSYLTATGIQTIAVMGNNRNANDTTSIAWTSQDGLLWIPLKTSSSTAYCPKLDNPSFFYYDNAFLAFGGNFETIYTSEAGIAWYKANKKIFLPAEFKDRGNNYSTVVDKNNFIWVIWSNGGANEVWRGRSINLVLKDRTTTNEMSYKEQIDLNRIPKHVAIIMDGNGRWAKLRGHERSFGHQAGAETVHIITEEAARLGIKFLTLYTFSTENWNRPSDEVAALMSLLFDSIEEETFMKNNISFRIIGDINKLPENVRERLNACVEHTSKNTGMCLILALSYSARWEITEATRQIATLVQNGEMNPEEITSESIRTHLTTNFMPDPDLLIRTGGEVRLSNYLLWQCAYSELYFCETFWPDFKEEELCKAICDYQKRERRFGKTSEQIS